MLAYSTAADPQLLDHDSWHPLPVAVDPAHEPVRPPHVTQQVRVVEQGEGGGGEQNADPVLSGNVRKGFRLVDSARVCARLESERVHVPSEVETVGFSDATVLCGGMLVVCVVGGAALLDQRRLLSALLALLNCRSRDGRARVNARAPRM